MAFRDIQKFLNQLKTENDFQFQVSNIKVSSS